MIKCFFLIQRIMFFSAGEGSKKKKLDPHFDSRWGKQEKEKEIRPEFDSRWWKQEKEKEISYVIWVFCIIYNIVLCNLQNNNQTGYFIIVIMKLGLGFCHKLIFVNWFLSIIFYVNNKETTNKYIFVCIFYVFDPHAD
ncbi:hypothetical protein PO909_007579, partial [Leuciscus waleckii]